MEAEGAGTDCYPQMELETSLRLEDFNQATMVNPRNAYQRYNAATNSSDRTLHTYMGTLLPRFGTMWRPVDDNRITARCALAAGDVELTLAVTGTDETSLQPVHAQHTWVHASIAWGARLADVVRRAASRRSLPYHLDGTIGVDVASLAKGLVFGPMTLVRGTLQPR